MVVFSPGLPALSGDVVSLYYTKDALLENLPVLIFYGPSTTGNSTQNGSLVQAHIYTLAGFQSFPRLTISPSSRLYAAVDHLPEDLRRNEVFRGLAVSLLSYFAGMPDILKASLRDIVGRRRPNRLAPAMFDEMHAGEVVSRMIKVEDAAETSNIVTSALRAQSYSWLDIDIVLPPQTITRVMAPEGSEDNPSFGDDGLPLFRYGEYDQLINMMGSPTFLPTSKMRRAPSRPTAHSKSRSLLKDQKISLRREMCELVDTEERYLGKLEDLVGSTSVEFRHRLESEDSAFGVSNSNILDRLFPQSLSTILGLNKSFYNDIQEVLQQTENEAISDIEVTADHSSNPRATVGRKRDLTGIAAFAKKLLKWFPKFTTPYQDFMRASSSFPNILNDYLQDSSTSFSKLASEFGEQRLRSALIEPVQRLPRYSLFIDNMVNLLPASHPGLASLLKARDIITDICALDSLGENNRTVSCLRNLIADWPISFSPKGRLITAVDIRQLSPPYKMANEGRVCMLLLFSEALVLLQKLDDNALSARGIIAEVDRPHMQGIAGQPPNASVEKGLKFQAAMSVPNLRLTESEDNHLIWVNCGGDLASSSVQSQSTPDTSQANTRLFSLLGAYEGKSRRFCEEVAKAKLENRFPETIRESDKWALRTLNNAAEDLFVLAAIWEADSVNNGIETRDLSRVRVLVEKELPTTLVLSDQVGLDILAYITPHEYDAYRLHIECVNDDDYTNEIIRIENLAATLVQRFAGLLRNQGQKLNSSRVSFHRDVLQSLPLHKQVYESRIRSFRPISPVKLLSNFLSTGLGNPSGSPSKPYVDTPILYGLTPKLRPLSMRFRPDNLQPPDENPSSSQVTVVEANGAKISNTFTLLEDTFAAYISALRSRSGNVIGKVLRSRAGADELVVNELYNILVEDPSRVQAAEEVSVDVLFAAFEKFLKVAWKEHMGPLLPANVIWSMQSEFDSGKHEVFTRHFRRCLEEMTPQNKRAFAATIKLLSELLDASGNDGDRGVLIASFAEALVLDGNPHDYINLLDRIVDDYDNFFEDTPVFSPDESKPAGSASNSLKRNQSFNTGSLSSNASSLGRRFGFGRSNDSSKAESDSKVASVWRTLNKNAKNNETPPQPASFSKASLVRSRSTDTDTRMLPPSRPVSRDLPPLPSPSTSDGYPSRPASSHLNFPTLSTIGEGAPSKPTVLTKKKRRSSLSDLKAANAAPQISTWWPAPSRQAHISHAQPEHAKTLPRTPSPSKSAFDRQENRKSPQPFAASQRIGLPQRYGSPQRFGSPERPGPLERPETFVSPQRFGSPERPTPSERPDKSVSSQGKENSPLSTRTNQPRKAAHKPGSDEAVSSTLSPKKRQSGIPTPKVGLSERVWPPNGNNSPKKLPQPSQKLRMQSPQKLRERLSNEQKAISSAETSLQAEIAKIGEDLSGFKAQRTQTKLPPNISTPHAAIDTLSTALDNLAITVNKTVASLTASTTSISHDVETSLVVADKKFRKIDELYREANAENEALYERFNDELGKILIGVKAGNGVEEMKGKMVEAQAEVARLKGENARLKREVAGLRSSIRDE